MRNALIPLLLLTTAPAAAADLEPTYTDVSACEARDLGPDEFVRECKGPGGAAAILHYFDGRAIVVFGPAGRGEEVVARDRANVIDEPLVTAAGADPFGAKIEWFGPKGAAPCAATIRVRAEGGDKLVTGPIASGSLTASPTNDSARILATAACGGYTDASSDAAVAAPATRATAPAPAPGSSTSASLEGKGLSICSQCSVPSLASLEGEGSSNAVATARLTHADAVSHCENWYGTDTGNEVEACVAGEMETIGGRTYRASADCNARTITASNETAYTFAGMGEDYGGRAPTWSATATGELAGLSRSGDSAMVTSQFDTLCPGAFAAEGFDRF